MTRLENHSYSRFYDPLLRSSISSHKTRPRSVPLARPEGSAQLATLFGPTLFIVDDLQTCAL
jgi:hypothetical protein